MQRTDIYAEYHEISETTITHSSLSEIYIKMRNLN